MNIRSIISEKVWLNVLALESGTDYTFWLIFRFKSMSLKDGSLAGKVLPIAKPTRRACMYVQLIIN